MTLLRVHAFSVSIDGFGAGPDQSRKEPMGVGGMDLHGWAFATRTFQRRHGGGSGGTTGIDEGYAARSFEGVGAWILGRNMFGPVRGPWVDDDWRGWWGENPVYHCPVYVLTHHAREPLVMQGGTTFHFVTGGLEAAWAQAKAAAGNLDVRLGGGVATLRAGLQARLVDHLHLAISPVCLGRGEALWPGVDLAALGYEQITAELGEKAMHVVFRRTGTPA